MKSEFAVELEAVTLLDAEMPEKMRAVREDSCSNDHEAPDFEESENPVFEPLERAWWLGGSTHVFARKDSALPEAIDRVFGAMAVNELEHRVTRVLSLDARLIDRGALRIYANGLPIVRVRAGEELAPTLEGTISGFAVRTRDDAAAFHAASILVDGHAVMLPGAKGSGKSTLALALALEGAATYLGDEVAFVGFDDHALQAFPKAATLKEGSFSLFAEVETFMDPIRGPVRYHRPDNAAAVGHRARISAIAFPRFCVGGPEAAERPLDPAQTAFELVRQSFGGLERDRRMMSLVAALSEIPAFIVEYSNASAAGRLIQHIVER
jgi:hypothetical protein